jgi:hypothetical protein
MQKLPDNFFFGIVTAVLGLALSSFLLYGLRLIIVNQYGYSTALEEPKLQMIAIVINVILFRLVMVNFKMEKTGRGILFTTVLLTFIYLFLYSRYHFRITPARKAETGSEEIRV